MVYIVYGTTGELIKILPLVRELERTGRCVTLLLSQQEEQLHGFFDAYPEMPRPRFWEVHGKAGRDLDKITQIPGWLTRAALAVVRRRKELLALADPRPERNIVLCHGDTITTVFGAFVARVLGMKLGHIEAGLRSFKLLHPFPEEIDRRLVSRFARVHFAPGAAPVSNLSRARGEIVDTGANTVLDSIQLARGTTPAVTLPDLPARYGIVSLHRNELLAQRTIFEQTMRTLAAYAKETPMVFLRHPVTEARIGALGLHEMLEREFISSPKMDYFSFMRLLDGSAFVVTDSGGLQEECAYIRTPCLVHRMATERREGIDEGIVALSFYEDAALRRFLDDPALPEGIASMAPAAPTQVILDYLRDHAYL